MLCDGGLDRCRGLPAGTGLDCEACHTWAVDPILGTPDLDELEELIFGISGADSHETGAYSGRPSEIRSSGTDGHEGVHSPTDRSANAAESAEISDDDQLLIAALQARPRASWQEIGDEIGASATTASRRWERLRSRGVAWISAYPARLVAATGNCWISVTAPERRRIAVLLAAHASTYWVEWLDGEYTFFAAIGAPTLRRLHDIAEEIAALPGVTASQLQVNRSVLYDGSLWQPRLAGQGDPRHRAVWGTATADQRAPSSTDLALFSALIADGRSTNVALASATGLSERTIRRRLPELFADGILNTRCDVCREALGLDVGLFLSIRWTAQWPTLANLARRIPGIRTVSGVSGSAPFLLGFWLRSTAEADRVIGSLHTAIPDLVVERIDFTIRSIKRYGRIFDSEGRVSGVVQTPESVAAFFRRN